MHLASSSVGGPGGEMALCLALAAPPAGSMHRPDSGADRLHAGLCHRVGPVVSGWPPSAPVLELYLAGPGEQLDGVLSVGTEGHRVTGRCSRLLPLRTYLGTGYNHIF